MSELKELAKAAKAYRNLKPPIFDNAGHHETNGVECSCGYISCEEDYNAARKDLATHIAAHLFAAQAHRREVIERLDKLLAKHLEETDG